MRRTLPSLAPVLLALALVGALPGALSGCAPTSSGTGGGAPEDAPEVPAFELTSADVAEGGELPQSARSSAGGGNQSPELSWSGQPVDTASFVVTVFDPDAPGGSFWHWAVYDIPGTLESLPADAGDPEAGLLPAGAVTLRNGGGSNDYLGAGPPSGDGPHRYIFTLTALDVETLDVPTGSGAAALEAAMADHVIARAVLTATAETP